MANTAGGTNAEDIREFLRSHEARPRNDTFLSPAISQPNVKLGEIASSWHESDVDSHVADYGFQAWARKSKKSKPVHNSSDLIGLEGSATQPATSSEDDLAIDLDQLLAESSNLANTLELAMLPAFPNDAQTYLPLGKVETICRRDVVRRELLRTFTEDLHSVDLYTNYVCGDQDDSDQDENSSRKIFANLVLIGQLDRINDFVEAGIKDRHLPFRKRSREQGGEKFALVKRLTLNRTGTEPLSCFNKWDSVSKRKFYDNQWRLLSPYFDRALDGSVGLYELDEQSIMPWIGVGEEKKGSFVPAENVGGFGKVTQVTIHPDHHDFEATKFAIKELFEVDDVPFTNEFRNLKKVETRDHLLPVYAAYRRGARYSFIFPWADGGSLFDLWGSEPLLLKKKVSVNVHEATDAHRTRKVITWVACQLAGLTGKLGLGFLHDTQFLEPDQPTLAVPEGEKRYGIHGDIKPHNILYFEPGQNKDEYGLGLFKISDFGLTGFHSSVTRSRHAPTGPHSPTYRSPEYGMSESYLSRKYDIWALGCVLLQFLTWLISGPQGLKQFDQDRFDEVDETNPNFKEDNFFKGVQNEDAGLKSVIKSSVESHIEALQRDVVPGNYLHDCLELIKTRILQIDVKDRADCREVHESLSSYHQRCLQDNKYATIALPTFEEAALPRSLGSIPDIRITNDSLNTQCAAPNRVSSDRVSTTTARTVSRVSTNNAPHTKDEGITGQGDGIMSQRDGVSPRPKISGLQEKPRRSKIQHMLSYFGFSCLISRPQNRRQSFTT
ncbi:kinase-like domain-containing protein [Xylaria castorea]|nr:kinase-like domain-containing protein [Xylaria castorea]